jgi:hypothetical protein
MADGIDLTQAGTLPPELYAQQQQLNRQQQLAQMLFSQNQQPQGQMISGRYVAPAWSQQLAPVIGMLTGAYLTKQGDTKAAELAKTLREGKASTEEKIIQQMTGTPAQATELAGPYAGNVPMPTAVQPSVAPNLAGALRTIRTNEFGAGKEYTPTILKQMMPEDTSDYKNFLKVKAEGFPGTFNDYQNIDANRKRPVTNTSTNIVNQMGKSIAGEVGPMMKEAQGIAQAAVKTEDSANRITQAIDSNKLFTGTGANVRLGAAQLANTLGLGGDTLESKIGNTRQAMQGLAELTLQGRQQMRGQGAITESESKLAERAISGDITFTPTELKQLAGAAKRASEYTYNTYQSKLGEMAKNPDTAGLVPYYQVPRMTPQGAMPDQSAIDAEIARRQGRR